MFFFLTYYMTYSISGSDHEVISCSLTTLLLTKCNHKWSVKKHPRRTKIPHVVIPHVSCPLVIVSPKTDINTKSEQGIGT